MNETDGRPSLLDSIQLHQPKIQKLLVQRQQSTAHQDRQDQENAADRPFSAPTGIIQRVPTLVVVPPAVLAEQPPPAACADPGEQAGPSRRRDEQWQAPSSQQRQSLRPQSFYAAASVRLQRVEDRVLRFLSNVRQRVDIGGGGAAATGADPWQQFPTQQAAFDFADAHDPAGDRLRIFSLETGPRGWRRFLVTSYAELWRRYRDFLPHHRHYYEIIRQERPCHLYLDLEFDVVANPGRSGQAAVDATLSLLRDLLAARLQLAMQDEWVIELDSSTDAKFSRHAVIRVPGAAFASNAHVGVLVLELCALVRERRAEDPRCELLIVQSRGGKGEGLFVDAGVYSRNRAFRLHLSSKAGKQAALLPTGRFRTAQLSTQQLFFQSLVCNVEPGVMLVRCFEEGAEGGADVAAAGRWRGSAIRVSPLPGGGVARQRPSPYPALDAFIESVCVEGGAQGFVRSWVSLDGGAQLLFNMRGNRHCGNVGRAHRSNGVFYVVDMLHGAWYQKCYDPECRHYRSPAMPLPPHLCGLWQPPEAAAGDGGKAGHNGGDPGDALPTEDADRGVRGEGDVSWDESVLAAVEQAERGYQRRLAERGGGKAAQLAEVPENGTIAGKKLPSV